MSVTIPDDLLETAHISEQELLQELAILLFSQDRLTMAQACKLARMNRLTFQHLLASRNVTVHYDIDAFKDDMTTLKNLGRL